MITISEIKNKKVIPNFFNCYVDGHLVMAFFDGTIALQKFANEIYQTAIFDEKITLDGKVMQGNTQLTASYALNDCYIANEVGERILEKELEALVDAKKKEEQSVINEILGLNATIITEEDENEEYSQEEVDYTDTVLDDEDDEDDDYTPDFKMETAYTEDWNLD